MDNREWKTPQEIDEMLRDLDEIAEDIEKAINMWPEIEAEFLAEHDSVQTENENENESESENENGNDPEPSMEEEQEETK